MNPLRSVHFRIFIAIAWFVWTGIIIPIHTRGVLPVAGTVQQETSRDCCHVDPERSPEKQKAPTPGNCAVCELTAKLSTPVTFTIDLRPAGFLAIRDDARPDAAYVCDVRTAHPCRGPPASVEGLFA